MIQVIQAKFIVSATSIKDSPQSAHSEVAFLGRSNVGKSSIINALLRRNGLAKSSQTPGKTRLINYFETKFKLDEDEYVDLVFVDLPGFGYAKVAKSISNEWQKNLDEFLRTRQNIRLFIHLRDARQYDMALDNEVDSYIKSFIKTDQKLINFYTKSDKLNQKERAQALKFDPSAHLVSTLNGNGIDAAREVVIRGALGL